MPGETPEQAMAVTAAPAPGEVVNLQPVAGPPAALVTTDTPPAVEPVVVAPAAVEPAPAPAPAVTTLLIGAGPAAAVSVTGAGPRPAPRAAPPPEVTPFAAGAGPSMLINAVEVRQVVTGLPPSSVPLTLKGATSQTGDLQQWQSGAGVVLARVTSAGRLLLSSDPLATLEAATKRYVDAVLPSQSGRGGEFLSTDGVAPSWAPVPPGYSDEQAQDAVGVIVAASPTIIFTYDDAAPSLTATTRQQMSVTADAGGLKLVNDLAVPGVGKYYGTDTGGVLGYFDLPVSTIEAEWSFITNSTMANPGTGKYRTNATTFVASTQLALAAVSNLGVDRTNLLKGLQVGDVVTIQDKSNAANWARYEVTGLPTNNTSWFLLPVTMVDGGGSVPSNNTPSLFTFVQAGGGGTGGSVGGAPGQIEYNNAGSFGGVPGSAIATSGPITTLVAPTATDTPLVVRGAPGQTAEVFHLGPDGDATYISYTPATYPRLKFKHDINYGEIYYGYEQFLMAVGGLDTLQVSANGMNIYGTYILMGLGYVFQTVMLQARDGNGSHLMIKSAGHDTAVAGNLYLAVGTGPTGDGNIFVGYDGTSVRGGLSLFGTGSFGGGIGVVSFHNAATLPTSNPVGGGILYADAGHLKWRDPIGVVSQLDGFALAADGTTPVAGPPGSLLYTDGAALRAAPTQTVTPAGYLASSKMAKPDPAELSAGRGTLWFRE